MPYVFVFILGVLFGAMLHQRRAIGIVRHVQNVGGPEWVLKYNILQTVINLMKGRSRGR